MILLSRRMRAISLSKMPMQPTSQNFPMERSKVGPRAGNTSASLAERGRSRLSSAVWVDCMVELSGRATWMPLLVGCLLLLGALLEMKLPVVPVSKMPVADMFGVGMGRNLWA